MISAEMQTIALLILNIKYIWTVLQGLLQASVVFTNKRSQAKGVYYVFLYKQYLDNVYTQTATHRFTLALLHAVAHGY